MLGRRHVQIELSLTPQQQHVCIDSISVIALGLIRNRSKPSKLYVIACNKTRVPRGTDA